MQGARFWVLLQMPIKKLKKTTHNELASKQEEAYMMHHNCWSVLIWAKPQALPILKGRGLYKAMNPRDHWFFYKIHFIICLRLMLNINEGPWSFSTWSLTMCPFHEKCWASLQHSGWSSQVIAERDRERERANFYRFILLYVISESSYEYLLNWKHKNSTS